MRLLHITAHLGGGVGKVLSRLVAESARRHDGLQHVIACLEVPEKHQFVEYLRSYGGEILIMPASHQLTEEIRKADIVQLEWWHHPVVAGWMCAGELPAMRLVVWSHVSGLHSPEIPPAFVAAPHRFLFTSPCSFNHRSAAALRMSLGDRLGVVFSSGGFEDLPSSVDRPPGHSLRVGYLGTLNFAKLHPRILDFVAAVRLPDFRVSMVGDPTTGPELLAMAARDGLQARLELRGYQRHVAGELAALDVLAYLLNPLHYGTTENGLLEAMAMGVVPVVLNNPAECQLVTHMETGLIIDGPSAFAEALEWLTAHPEERKRLSTNARRMVRQRFAVQRTADELRTHYQAILAEDKRSYDFRGIFGPEPADWFRSCQGTEGWRFSDDHPSLGQTVRGPAFLYERTKSSVFHYRAVYPADARLARWSEQLEAVQ